MKRTAAAFTILLALTALMIGLYVDEPKTLAEILRNYSMLYP